jgi:hypothetical protein
MFTIRVLFLRARISRLVPVLVLAAGTWSVPARANEICSATEESRLATEFLSSGANFGAAAAVSGFYAAVGAPRDGESNTGSVHLYTIDGTTWGSDAKLTPPPSHSVHLFGAAVSLRDNMLAVGAPGTRVNEQTGAGAVFIYIREPGPMGRWHLVSTLVSDNPRRNDEFGTSVSLADGYLLVGIPGDDGSCALDCARGAANVYRRVTADGSQWAFEARLAIADSGDNDRLGRSVAMVGTSAAVGSPGRGLGPIANVGAVRVFERIGGSWTLAWTMVGTDSSRVRYFGTSLAVQGDRLVAGAPGTLTTTGIAGGAAFVYERPAGDLGPWVAQAELTYPAPAANDQFGTAVALDDNVVLVGAPRRDVVCSPPGSSCDTGGAVAFVHDATVQRTWGPAATLIHSEAGQHTGAGGADWFASSVALHDGRGIIGATMRDTIFRNFDQGAAYAFLGLSDCDGNGLLDYCEVKSGAADDCNSNFAPDTCLTDCNADAVADACVDLPSGAVDCNANGSADDCELAAGLAQDVDSNGVPDDCECFALADCDDGLYCTGVESCIGGACVSTGDPCAGSLLTCDEMRDECVECFFDADCGDSLTCNGAEVCVSGHCRAGTNPCQADCQAFETLALGAANAPDDRFGLGVALHNDVAVIGAPWNDELGNNAGVAYVYRRIAGQWQEEAQLHAFGPDAPVWFGSDVAIDRDVIAVGAWPGGNSGTVYVFRHDGSDWIPEATLRPEADAGADDFAAGVDVSGDVIVVGAKRDTQADEVIGAAYVFRRVGDAWNQEARLFPPEAGDGWNYGEVAVDGNVIAVGATGAEGAGRVFVYRHAPGQANPWPQEAMLGPANLQSGAAFGISVDVQGSRLIAGAMHQGSWGTAYVYDYNGAAWQLRPSLSMSSSVDPHDYFGYTVALAGPFAVIGVRTDDDGAGNVGSAMIVRWSGTAWVYEAKLSPSAQQVSAGFGESLAFDGSTILVGVSGMDTEAGADAGAVLVYENIALSTPGQSIDVCSVRSGACCNRSACSPVWATAECEATPVCDVWDHLPDTFIGCHGDTNGDGVVNAGDRGTISAAIGRRDPANLCVLDMDGNGFINAADRGFVAAAIGRCDRLPDFQNGSGLNRGLPDARFEPGQFAGPGTSCEEAACTP